MKSPTKCPFRHAGTHIDGHESKPAMCILAIIEEIQKTSIISYFDTYSF